MKLFAILLLCTVGMVYSMSLNANTPCSVCKSAMNWVRSNDGVLSFMKADEQVSYQFIELLESDAATTDLCGLLSMCENDQGHGGHGGHGGGTGHGGHGGHGSGTCHGGHGGHGGSW